MSDTSIDFNQLLKRADATGFTLVPDDTYDCVVEKASLVTSSTGKPMVKVTLQVENGPHARRKLFTQHVLSVDNDNALRFFFEHMAAYGFSRQYFEQPGASLDAIAASLPGKRVRAEVGHKVYQGTDRNEVKKVLPPVGGAVAGSVSSAGVPQVAVPNASPAPQPAAAPPPVQASGAPVIPQVPSTTDEEPF